MAAMTGNAIREALEPFAKIAEHDIGADEADTDFFQPMVRYNSAPRLTVGDLRRARAAYDAIVAAGSRSLDHADTANAGAGLKALEWDEAEIERWRENSRANWEAFSAMRNDINELVGNMASGEAALINGPEMQHQCEAVATSVRDKLERQERLLLEASSDAGKWEDRCRAAEAALAETRERLENLLEAMTSSEVGEIGRNLAIKDARNTLRALTGDAQEASR